MWTTNLCIPKLPFMWYVLYSNVEHVKQCNLLYCEAAINILCSVLHCRMSNMSNTLNYFIIFVTGLWRRLHTGSGTGGWGIEQTPQTSLRRRSLVARKTFVPWGEPKGESRLCTRELKPIWGIDGGCKHPSDTCVSLYGTASGYTVAQENKGEANWDVRDYTV